MDNIRNISEKYNFDKITTYGDFIAKVPNNEKFGKGKVILVTAFYKLIYRICYINNKVISCFR